MLTKSRTAEILKEQKTEGANRRRREVVTDLQAAAAMKEGVTLSEQPTYGDNTAMFYKGTGALFPAGVGSETSE